MSKASGYLISLTHLPKRTTRGVAKDEILIVNFKATSDVKSPVQTAYLYPAQGQGEGLLRGTFLDELDIEVGPDARDVTRTVILDVRLVAVPV